jgi:TolB-like protein
MKLKSSILLAVIVGLTGCAAQSAYVAPPRQAVSRPAKEAPAPQTTSYAPAAYVVTEPLTPQESGTQAGRFNSKLIFLADQLERNVDRKTLSNTFIVTTFTNLNKLSETTSFGRLVAENVMHELQVRRWQVFEVRLTKDVVVNDTGEFSLSRDINRLKELYNIGGIVTGTYSVADGNIVVNARVIDINTGIVISSAQTYIPANYFTDALLYNERNLKPMRIVGDGADAKSAFH